VKATVQKESRPAQTNGEPEFVTPEVNIFETKDGYVLEAEMPGVNKEAVEITLEGNELTIIGRRHNESAGEALLRESRNVDFRRVFELDPAIDGGKISAKMEQGVLTLTLPKSESRQAAQDCSCLGGLRRTKAGGDKSEESRSLMSDEIRGSLRRLVQAW
jgi:HSP20 family protein